ncbi:MBL fold metallo-hydrolase [Streptomyces prasinus]|uniref:MBL fold metallo-hydrolase n=1 Tax=Streptomyces prasinus TaxID=67345 RepID=UPI00363288EC
MYPQPLGDGNFPVPAEAPGAGHDRERLLDSLVEAGGSPESVVAVLLTHDPPDHLGSAEPPQAAYGTPVYAHEAEVPRARRDFLQQVAVGQALRNSRRPGAPPRAPRSGGPAHGPVAAPGQGPRSGPPARPPAPPPPAGARAPGIPEGCGGAGPWTRTRVNGRPPV